MSLSQELDDFLQEVETVLTAIPTDLEDTRVDLDRVLMSAEWLLRDIMQIKHIIPDGEALTTAVSEVMSNVQAAVDQSTVQHRRGRPAIDIPEEQLEMLLEHHFTEADIARMMQVSPRTIRRRIIQYILTYQIVGWTKSRHILCKVILIVESVAIRASYAQQDCIFSRQESKKA